MHTQIGRVVDLLDPSVNHIYNMTVEEARARLLADDPASVRAIERSFALVASQGRTVRLARSLDRPMRYFLAKRREGPALFVADRIDTLRTALDSEGLADQFHPAYTRMVPGTGPLHRRSRAGRLSRSRSAVRAVFHSPTRNAAG